MESRMIGAGWSRTGSASAIVAWTFVPAFFFVVWLQACAPASAPSPPRYVFLTPQSPPPPAILNPKRQAPATSAPDAEAKVKEEAPAAKRPAPAPKSPAAQPPTGSWRDPSPPAPTEDDSLIAMITPRTPPRRAASLRLTEEGRKLLQAGDYAKALSRLEKTIAIDSTNPYGYYYLAKAHHHMGRYRESLSFLDVAESLLVKESYWLAEVFALKGENFLALGFLQRASSSYSDALRLNPGNRVAADGLYHLKDGSPKLQ